ncbi:hypothetical protein EVAR_72328_1, partial [Eumeta japonica]
MPVCFLGHFAQTRSPVDEQVPTA